MFFIEDLPHLFVHQMHTVQTSHFPSYNWCSVLEWLHKCYLQSHIEPHRNFSFIHIVFPEINNYFFVVVILFWEPITQLQTLLLTV